MPSRSARGRTTITSRIRWILAIISIVITISAIGFAATNKFLSEVNFDAKPYSDALKAGTDIRLEHSKNYFEMTLLTLGALWALLVAQKGETRVTIADRPEIIMLAGALVVLLLSLLWHNFYLDSVSVAYSKATDVNHLANAEPSATSKPADAAAKNIELPDVFQPAIDGLLKYQAIFFVLGVIQAIFTLVSSHNLKEVQSP